MQEEINMEKQKYYITTAIAYTSGKPHIGNTYEVVLADAIARYKETGGIRCIFPDRNGRAWSEDRAEGGGSGSNTKGICG